MSIPNYDNWKLSSGRDDEKVNCNCDHCGGEIYEGQEYYTIELDNLHEECLLDYVKDNIAERRE